MKFVKLAFLFLLIFTSCKTTKNVTSTTSNIKEFSAKKVAKKHLKANFDAQTVDAKLRVKFKNTKENQSFSVRMKIKKDEVIWLKGTKIISVFRAKITPTEVRYYSPLAKHYFEGDFSLIKDFLGVDITFEELQNIFLGQTKIENKGRDLEVEIREKSYMLTPEEQSAMFERFLFINPTHFKLNKYSLVHSLKNQRLDLKYPKYLEKDDVIFPENIIINVKDRGTFTNVNITVKSVNFNTNLSMPFSIPSGYKELSF